MSDLASLVNPAGSLLGMELKNGWRICELIKRKPTDTGGHFSVGYLVENQDGRKAYLKALDLTSAFSLPDPIRMVQIYTSSFLFERDLLYRCRTSKLSRVVVPLDDGNVLPSGFPPTMTVYYIIFELAEGDLRKQFRTFDDFDLAIALRVLHDAAVGIEQLHKNGIAHQDLKPSNVLAYADTRFKIGDLGRASDSNHTSITDSYQVPGDRNYVPFEYMYAEHPIPSFSERFLLDIFLLGSLVFFLFTGLSAQQAIAIKLRELGMNPSWQSLESDLPIIQLAYQEALLSLKEEIDKFSNKLSSELIPLVEMLTNPDPSKRGHRTNIEKNIGVTSLERFISQFDLLANKVEYGML